MKIELYNKMNFFYSNPEPPPPPKQIGFFQMLVYLWIFCMIIQYLDDKTGGKLIKKRMRKKKEK